MTSSRVYFAALRFCHTTCTMLPPVDAVSGSLPLGRFGAELAEIKATFVDAPEWAGSTTRAAIWNDFESATAGIRSVVPVAWVWVGGSFISNKLDPDDIDVVYWCEDRFVDRVTDPREKYILQLFATNQVRAKTKLRVDTRYCRWHVFPEATQRRTIEHNAYSADRGYWDDLWLRKRSGAKTDPPVRDDALPRRGYAEVMLDGLYVV